MNIPVVLEMLILELSKKKIYELWFNSIKPKSGDKEKHYCMDIDSLINQKKAGDI